MKPLDFLVVNSFATRLFGGNPAAVFWDTQGLPADTMQAVARQMNLVETVFVLPAESTDADFRFRYFTPEEELPVAGHPTIAACVALAHTGRIDPAKQRSLRIQTGKGTVDASLSGTGGDLQVFMEQPKPIFGGVVSDRGNVAGVLGLAEADLVQSLPVVPVDTGLGHLIVPVGSLRALMGIKRNIVPLKALCAECGAREAQAFAFEAYDSANRLHTRNICPREGLEDPACGVGNGALAAYLGRYLHASGSEFEVKAEQGAVVNMPSLIITRATRQDGEWSIRVGGMGRVMIEGRLYL